MDKAPVKKTREHVYWYLFFANTIKWIVITLIGLHLFGYL